MTDLLPANLATEWTSEAPISSAVRFGNLAEFVEGTHVTRSLLVLKT
jgi:hypothetical protein